MYYQNDSLSCCAKVCVDNSTENTNECKCNAGFGSTDNKSCVACSGGTTSFANNNSCSACASGYFCPADYNGSNLCTPHGTLTGNGGNHCQCPTGYSGSDTTSGKPAAITDCYKTHSLTVSNGTPSSTSCNANWVAGSTNAYGSCNITVTCNSGFFKELHKNICMQGKLGIKFNPFYHPADQWENKDYDVFNTHGYGITEDNSSINFPKESKLSMIQDIVNYQSNLKTKILEWVTMVGILPLLELLLGTVFLE